MSVPRGKKVRGGASRASITFHESSDDIRSYFTLGQLLKGQPASIKHLENVSRGVYVLISALWESYCEDLALEAAEVLVSSSVTPDDLPAALARRIAIELRSDKHELSPWKLAGDGWRELALSRVAHIARDTIFNSPKPAQVDQLFDRAIGLSDISAQWPESGEESEPDVRVALQNHIERRGEIAHGFRPRPTITKRRVSQFFQLTRQLVYSTDGLVGSFLEDKTGVHPWAVVGSTAVDP